MENTRKVHIAGETTFDIIFKGEMPQEARVGGSQLNTSISLGRLGVPVMFITMFGSDQVGAIAQRFLNENGISVDFVTQHSGNSRVALAFLDELNNAHYTFYKPVVEQNMKFSNPGQDDIVLFGSSFAVKAEGRDELMGFIQRAGDNGAIILYDPNFRKANNKHAAQAKSRIVHNIRAADMVKGSDEDFFNIFGANDASQTWEAVSRIKRVPLIYTCGSEGVWVRTPSFEKHYPVPAIKPVSTIGAGDVFSAGVIYRLYTMGTSKEETANLSESQWDRLIGTATDFARHVCMHYDNYLSEAFAREQQ